MIKKIVLLALTGVIGGSCYPKCAHKRIDLSPDLQKLALKRIKQGSPAIQKEIEGKRVAARPPIKITTAQIMARAQQAAVSRKIEMESAISTNPIVLSQFTSANYRQTGQYGPSSEAGKGTTQIMIGQKGRVMTFLPDGTPDNVLNVSHDHFFSSVSLGGFTADPNIIFDASSGRWFLFCDGASPFLLLAMSDGDPITANTVWSFFIIDSTTPNPGFDAVLPNFDYTTLAVDTKAVYCAANVYNDTNPAYLSSAAYVILKDSLIAGQTPVIFAFRNLVDQSTYTGPFTLQGALNFDPNPTAGFFVSINLLDVLINSSQNLLINKATFTSTGVTLSAPVPVPVTPYVGPLFASALGTPEPLFDPGVRLCPAHIRNGILRVVHEIGVDNTGVSTPATVITRNAANFYEISTETLKVLNQGRVFQPSPFNDVNQRCFLVPSIMSNALGQVIICATTCGKQERLNACVTQIKNGVPGTPLLYTDSTSNYFATEDWEFDPNSRWGDHTRVSADPNDTTFWAASLWCNATNTWATQIAHIQAS